MINKNVIEMSEETLKSGKTANVRQKVVRFVICDLFKYSNAVIAFFINVNCLRKFHLKKNPKYVFYFSIRLLKFCFMRL